jgi:hypothetical protein
VVRGAWWLYIDADRTANFYSKCTDRDRAHCFFAIASFLCYDFFEYTAANCGRDDPTFVTSHVGQWRYLSELAEMYGTKMPAEVFLEIYEANRMPADITDRKRLRHQRKVECLLEFRNKFQK